MDTESSSSILELFSSDDDGQTEGYSTNRNGERSGSSNNLVSRNSDLLRRERVEEQFKEACRGPGTRGRYYIPGIVKGSVESFEKIYHAVDSASKTARFIFVVYDGDHWHIIHDCSYSNKSCRCFRQIKLTCRTGVKHEFHGLSERNQKQIIDYLFENGKSPSIIRTRIDSDSHTLFEMGVLQPERRPEKRNVQTDNVEICDDQSETFDRREETRTKRSWSDASISDDELYPISKKIENFRAGRARKRLSAYEETCEKIKQKLKTICSSPITSGVDTEYYNVSEMKWNTTKNDVTQKALHSLKLDFKYLKIFQYIDFYEKNEFLEENSNYPLWQAYNYNNFKEKYTSENEGTDILHDLLAYQLGLIEYNEEDGFDRTNYDGNILAEFVKNLCAFLNYEMGKQNTWYIVGPANCGKSLFADLLQDFFLNVGIMGNWNKHMNFPLQMCEHVRLVFWNEPNFAPEKKEDLKKLLGGDRMTFDIKNKPHGVIHSTPIIITANQYIFENNDIWTTRIKRYHWKQAPFLKKCNKRIHPYAFINLIKNSEQTLGEYFASENVIKI